MYNLTQKILSLSDNGKAILMAITFAFLFSLIICIVRYLSQDFDVMFIAAIRNIAALIFLIPLILKQGLGIFTTKRLKLHFFRSIIGVLGMVCWFYVIANVPLPEAVSISFCAPIFTTIAAILFLKERFRIQVIFSLLIGVLGVLIVLQPAFAEFKVGFLVAIVTTILWGAVNVTIKILTRTEKPETIVAYFALFMAIFTLPFIFNDHPQLTTEHLMWFAVIGFISNFSHYFLSKAFLKVEISLIQPYDFTRLIFVSVIAFFAFGQVVGFNTIIGSAVIMLGGLTALPKKKKEVILQEKINEKF